MNYYFNNTCYLCLDLFENCFINTITEKIIEPALPLAVTIQAEDCMLYENDKKSLIDYSPTTLGYYWISGNTCIRTREGLVFEPSDSEEDAVQFSFIDGEFYGQKINSDLSKEPSGHSRYSFRSLTGAKGIIHKESSGTYTLEIEGLRHAIYYPELEFSYPVSEETGFHREADHVDYYGRKLPPLSIDKFTVLNFNYAKDDRSVFCGDKLIPEADPSTFEVITITLAKDKNHLYGFSRIVESADPATFEIIDGKYHDAFELYGKDKNSIYYFNEVIFGADLESFSLIRKEYSVDKNWVYRSGKRVPSLDVDSFEYISGKYIADRNGIYDSGMYVELITKNREEFLDHGHEYFSSLGIIYWQNCMQKIDASISSFESIDYSWAKDDGNIFYQNRSVFEGDCSEVRLIDELILFVDGKVVTNRGVIENAKAEQWQQLMSGFFRSDDLLFYHEELINNGDPGTLEKIDEWRLKDKNNVYLIDEHFHTLEIIYSIGSNEVKVVDEAFLEARGSVYFYELEIVGVDTDTFTPLEYGFSRDKNAIFFGAIALSELNPDDVTIVDHNIIHDSKNVFYQESLIDINVNKMEQLTDQILKDDLNVYYKDKRIIGAHASSYSIQGVFFQKDKNSVYHNNKRLDLVASNTTIKGEVYAMDGNRAFFIDEEIMGVDVPSLEIIEDSISRDKNHVYFRENIIENADPLSFKIIGYSQFIDKNNIYQMRNGKVCICE